MALDVLLVAPPSVAAKPYDKDGGMTLPLGLGYLAAVLEQAGYNVELLDMAAEQARGADVTRIVRDRQPRVVGISTMVVTYKNGLRIAELVKAASPMTKVIVGGPQATFLVEETLACPAVDVLARYEGEETILELMRHFDGDGSALDQIRGIAFRVDGRICETGARHLIKDLDRLPFPARHLFKLDRYAKPGVLITARGCPSRCVFCAANTLYVDPPYRARAPRFIVDEIEEMVNRHGLNSFFIADDAFTLWPKRAIEICDLIIERRLAVQWTCEARVNTMTPVLARKMVEAGCIEVQYGVETGNPDIMQLIRKGISLEQVETVVNYSQAIGLDVICSFIIGFPWDTADTVRQTLDFALRLGRLGASAPNRGGKNRGRVVAMYSPLTPLPGTTIYQHAEALGIRFLTRDWDRFTFTVPVIETPHLSAVQVRQALYGGLGQAQSDVGQVA